MTTPLSHIRNFSIIAHIDHGKSTLADRLIQFTGGLTAREMSAQVLDNMDIEKERGITIKAQTVRLKYTAKDGETYELNLMDTPGHVDFAYEVSRSLAACEGALLVVDAAQGVEAQTLANVYQSIEHDHEIVPVINKIDLPAADVDKVKAEIEDIIGLPADDAVLASAKAGIGIEEALEAIVTRIPPPKGDATAPLVAMLVDSWYDPYLGVVILVRVVDGTWIEHEQEKVAGRNKSDVPAAEGEKGKAGIEDIIGLPADEGVLASAKAGIGIEEALEAIVTRIPPPKGDATAPLVAMLVDSWYDPYLGVVILVRVVDGILKKGQQIKFMQAGTTHLIDRVGCFTPKREELTEIGTGEIGFITAQIKDVAQARVGDTVTDAKKPAATPLPGFKEVQPVVFCGMFPTDANDFEKLRESIQKLRLNDASFSFEMESSAALGFGFRCGFLGLLHLEIIQERLTREYDLDLITTAPSVVYKLKLGHTKNEAAKEIELHNPAAMPAPKIRRAPV